MGKERWERVERSPSEGRENKSGNFYVRVGVKERIRI
jgi:hypothetical protein